MSDDMDFKVKSDVRKRGNFSKYDLINAVREEELLWNREHKLYSNRSQRELAWLNIASGIWDGFDKKTVADQHNVAVELSKTWKNLKDCYLRNRRRCRGPDDPLYTPYVYEKELEFAFIPKTTSHKRPLKRRRPAASIKHEINTNMNVLDEDFVSHDDIANNSGGIEEAALLQLMGNDSSQLSSSTISEFCLIENPKKTELQYCTQPPVDMDCDSAFFESIRPHLKKLTSTRKLDFQIGVLKLLRELSNHKKE